MNKIYRVTNLSFFQTRLSLIASLLIVPCIIFSQTRLPQKKATESHPRIAALEKYSAADNRKVTRPGSNAILPVSKQKKGLNSMSPSVNSYYVNDSYTGDDIYTTAAGDDLNLGTASSPFATIGHAISVASAGDIIYVDAGTYAENIDVDKQIDLRGTNYGTNPNTATRIAESVIYPATSEPDPYSINSRSILYLQPTSSDVLIDGFKFDGDNPALTSGLIINGADVDAIEAIGGYEGVSGLSVNNNMIVNTSYSGVDLDNFYSGGTPTTGNTVSNNLFDNLLPSAFGIAIIIYDNCYTNITNNVMTRVKLGVQTGNFYLADPGSSNLIQNNQIESARRGIWENLAYGSASALSILNNTITTYSGSVNNDGIMISSLQTTAGTVVSGNIISDANIGYNLWNNPTSSTVTISGGTVTNCVAGIFANNFDGYVSDAASSSYIVDNVGISGGTTGIYVKDNNLNSNSATVSVQIQNSTNVSGSATGLKIEGNDATAAFSGVSPAAFTGQTIYVTQVTNSLGVPSAAIDATAVSFDGNAGAAMTDAQLFATEDKIQHKMDDVSLGFVIVKTDNNFVTTSSGTIQRGIDLAPNSSAFTVNVANGTYTTEININKSITVKGQSHAAIIRGPYAGTGNAIIISASNAKLKNVTVTRDYGITLADWYACPENQGVNIGQTTTGVTIQNVEFTGNRNAIFCNNAQNVLITECDIHDNRTGVHYGNNVNGAILANNFIHDNFTHGVLFNFDLGVLSAQNAQINNNSITGNWYSQVNFQRNSGAPGNVGNLTGLSFSCNWYGTQAPKVNAINAAEPGYAGQPPSQFGGSNPNLPNRHLVGIEAALIPYIPWLVNGTDNDIVAEGFQPAPGSCNGTILVASVASTADALCYGASSGSIDITVSGGSGSYSYAWSNSVTTQDNPNIPAGVYSVTISDTYGQTVTLSGISIGEPTQLVASSVAGTILCNSGTTTVTVSATGGTAPYNGTGAFTTGAGNYSYPVTDNNGCTSSATGNLSQPTPVVVSAVPGTIQCPGGTTSVAVSATGGTPPYSGVGVFAAAAGPHTYNVTDANGCPGSKSITIADGTGTPPAKPNNITGSQYNLCGGGDFNYTVAAVSGATSYVFTVPPGFSLVQVVGRTATIHIPASFTTSAQIKAAASNACGTGLQAVLTVYAVAPNPSTAITGPTSVNVGQNNVFYSLPNGAGVTYTWSVPAGVTLLSGQGTNKIKVKFGNTSGYIKVFVSNACGSSPQGRLFVTVGGSIVAETDASIKATSVTAEMRAYPNPVKQIANVVFNANKNGGKVDILVTDANGTTVLRHTGTTLKGENIVKLDMSRLANGIYIAKVITDEQTGTIKLVKTQ